MKTFGIAEYPGLKFTHVNELGDFLVVDSGKLVETLEYIRDIDSVQLYLNWQLGFTFTDLSFLEGVELLIEGLMIVVDKFDFSGLCKFVNIKYLHFSDDYNQLVDFSVFTKLTNCSIKWNSSYQNSIFPSSITSLNIRSYNNKNGFNELSLLNMCNVTEITLLQPVVSDLSLFEYCGPLTKIHVAHGRTLIDISALITHSKSLTHLEVDKCKKIKSFDPLFYLVNIEWLNICDCNKLVDVLFVQNMPLLTHFVFYGTLVENGDLSYLKGIEQVAFDNKSHYSLKQKDFE